MLRRPCILALVSSMFAVAPAVAVAMPVSNSTVPSCISLVGSDGTSASSIGTFTVIVRDLANNPMPGVHVRVDLANAPDLRLCAQQLASGVILDCPGNAASVITDGGGRAVFTLMGSAIAGSSGSGLGNGRIYADGTLLSSPTVSAYDLDGASGVGANDFSLWFQDFTIGATYARSDLDCNGYVGANDLSFWLTAFGGGAQSVSCSAKCP